jgi:hypothetical protein
MFYGGKVQKGGRCLGFNLGSNAYPNEKFVTVSVMVKNPIRDKACPGVWWGVAGDRQGYWKGQSYEESRLIHRARGWDREFRNGRGHGH